MDHWKKHPEFSLIYSAYDKIMANGEKKILPLDYLLNTDFEGAIYPLLLQTNTVAAPTILLEKSTFLAVNGFNTSYPALEDWDFAIKVSRTGPLGFIDTPQLLATSSPGGISSSHENYFTSRCMLLDHYYDDIISFGLFDSIVYDIMSRASAINMNNEIRHKLEKVICNHT